jgi:hypothetical protein
MSLPSQERAPPEAMVAKEYPPSNDGAGRPDHVFLASVLEVIHVHVGRPGPARHRPTKARPTKAHIQLWAVPCQHVCPVIGPRHSPQLVMCARPAQIAQNVLMCQTGPYTYNSNTSSKSIKYIYDQNKTKMFCGCTL